MRLEVTLQIGGALEDVGTIETLPGHEPVFTYAEEWLERPDPKPLSLSMPLTRQPLPDRRIRPYFEGLLPEEDARQALARELGISSTSYLKMFAAVGEECIGAVAAEDMDDEAASPDRYEPLKTEDLERIAGSSHGLTSELFAGSRLSLAGAQAKAGLYLDPADKRWYRPFGRAPSSHIVKPGTSRFPALIDNETYCMGLAAACGLRAARVSRVGTEAPMMAIERYDRVATGQTRPDGHTVFLRLHQEDFCQALGILPQRKYEEGAARRMRDMGALLERHSTDASADALALFDAVVFNYLIGNCDAHLKNFSLMRSPDWSELRLAPSYDLVSTTVYPELTRVLAVRMGTRRRIDEVTREDVVAVGEDLRIDRRTAARRLDAMVEALAGAVDALVDSDMAAEIARQAKGRAMRVSPPGLVASQAGLADGIATSEPTQTGRGRGPRAC